MIESETSIWIQSREHAGLLLGKKLHAHKNTNAVVVGIPHGGVCVAAALASVLCLPLEVMPCRKIKHPGDRKKNIGSVSIDEVFIHDCPHGVPQNYIYHQILSLRNAIEEEDKYYHADRNRVSLSGKTIILVDDILKSNDTIISCLRSIKKQRPFKVIVAVPVASEDALKMLRLEADHVVCLRVDRFIASGEEYFSAFPKIDQGNVRNLLNTSRQRIIPSEYASYTRCDT